METEAKLYTISEVAERFKVNPRTVMNWIREGDLKAYAVGNTESVIRISESQIGDYLENHPLTNEKTPRDNGDS